MKQFNGTYTVHTLFQHIRWKHTNSAKPKNHTRTHRSLIRSQLATSYLWILFISISCFLKITVDRSEKSTSYVITHSCITDTRQIFTHTDPTHTIICIYKQCNIYMESIYLSIYPSVSAFLHQLSIRLSIPTPSLFCSFRLSDPSFNLSSPFSLPYFRMVYCLIDSVRLSDFTT